MTVAGVPNRHSGAAKFGPVCLRAENSQFAILLGSGQTTEICVKGKNDHVVPLLIQVGNLIFRHAGYPVKMRRARSHHVRAQQRN